ncbi:MAG: acyl-CoA dehydrogenase family protein [Saprospiraceae bacterium]|nr:acyl-CoA dehydrogenase family protein [Saprospiraceae bacterium]|tara:strand:+ start:1353 stop:2495 length:1143 start_codon:yes stop_codon:yes gene_type:complete
MRDSILTEEHLMFKEAVEAFFIKEAVPYAEKWEKDGVVDRDIWTKAGAMGILCTDMPEAYGGMGLKDFRYNSIVTEVMIKLGVSGPGFVLQNDVMAPYFERYFTPAQKDKWLSGIVSGEIITAIAMTEPNTGSDLAGITTTAVKKGDHYLLNGSKTYITNGILSDLVVVVAKTDASEGHKGMTLLLVERGMEGFERGKNLDKIGLKAQDTAEMFFRDVKVPLENVLGEEGRGFYYLMHNLPQERLSIAVGALAAAERALDDTLTYVKERTAFGRPIGSFQNSRFKMAEMNTEITIARTFVDECIMELNESKLSNEKASMAKYWVTEMSGRVIDQCLQLYGGAGYMWEYPIARAYANARVNRIFGGTNEIMKEIIGRSMGL